MSLEAVTMATEEQSTPGKVSKLPQAVQEACEILKGNLDLEVDAGTRRSAFKDISARGSVRSWWYRMVWRNGEWSYLCHERVPQGTFYAADRHYIASDPVFRGDLLIIHDRGCGVDTETPARLVIDEKPDNDIKIEIKTTRDGRLKFQLPDGDVFYTNNPRRR